MIAASATQTGNGKVTIKEMYWETGDGIGICANLYSSNAAAETPASAVASSHGVYNNVDAGLAGSGRDQVRDDLQHRKRSGKPYAVEILLCLSDAPLFVSGGKDDQPDPVPKDPQRFWETGGVWCYGHRIHRLLHDGSGLPL